MPLLAAYAYDGEGIVTPLSTFTVTPQAAPGPVSMAVLGAGLLALGIVRVRRRTVSDSAPT